MVRTTEKHEYRLNGRRYSLADGIERGEPNIEVVISLPEEVDIDEDFIKSARDLVAKIEQTLGLS